MKLSWLIEDIGHWLSLDEAGAGASAWSRDVPSVGSNGDGGHGLDPTALLLHAAHLRPLTSIGVAVFSAPFWTPVLLARQASTLAQLFKGEVRIGLGSGEGAAASGSPRARAERLLTLWNSSSGLLRGEQVEGLSLSAIPKCMPQFWTTSLDPDVWARMVEKPTGVLLRLQSIDSIRRATTAVREHLGQTTQVAVLARPKMATQPTRLAIGRTAGGLPILVGSDDAMLDFGARMHSLSITELLIDPSELSSADASRFSSLIGSIGG